MKARCEMKFHEMKIEGNSVFFSFLEIGSPLVDQVYILQGFKEGWKDGKFEEKIEFRDCLEPVRLHKVNLHDIFQV